jgi:membrane protein YqaA with SNARE-associated domain
MFAVLGACLGGALMWTLGRTYQVEVVGVLDKLPAISESMIARAEGALSGPPFVALIKGAFSGVPYKIFASVAANAGIGLPVFLLITIPARAARFLLLAAATALADRFASRWLDRGARTALLAAGWVLFYAGYWLLMPN